MDKLVEVLAALLRGFIVTFLYYQVYNFFGLIALVCFISALVVGKLSAIAKAILISKGVGSGIL